MTTEHPAPIEYARPAPAPRPGFWLLLGFALGWIFTIFGGLGVLANSSLIISTWYFDFPLDRARQLKTLGATVLYTLFGLWLLRIRYRKRGAR